MPTIDADPKPPRDGHGLSSAPCSAAWLRARAVIAGDLYREGRITREECLRLEIDALHNEDTGPIKYETRNDETHGLH